MPNMVDSKVVELKFNNQDFEKKVESTLDKLGVLDRALQKVGSGEVFNSLTKGAKDVDLSHINKSAEDAQHGLSKLEAFSLIAFANISNSVINLGKKIARSFIDPLVTGGLTRAKNLELANFQFEGLNIEMSKADKLAGDYEMVMDAVLGTAYSYDVAAKAASQLAASNIGITESEKTLADGSKKTVKYLTKDMTSSIRAMAGVASMTGKPFEQVSQIFTRVAGQGRVMGNDLLSLSSMGLNAAATLGKYLGKTEADVRDMVTKGKISFADFSKAMDQAYGQHAKESTKTFSGALEDVKAALARISDGVYGSGLTGLRDILNSITPIVDIINGKLNDSLTNTESLISRISAKTSDILDLVSYSLKAIEGKDSLESWLLTDTEEHLEDHLKVYTNLLDMFKNTSVVRKAVDQLTKYGMTVDGMSVKINGMQMLTDYLGLSEEEVNKKIKDGTIGLREYFDAFYDLYMNSSNLQSIKGFYAALLHNVKDWADEAANSNNKFKTTVGSVQSILKGFGAFIKTFGTIFKNVVIIASAVLKVISPLGKNVLDLAAVFGEATGALADFLTESKAGQSIIEHLTHLIKTFGEALHLATIGSWIVNGVTNIVGAVIKAFQKLFEGAKSIFNKIVEVIDKVIDGTGRILEDTNLLIATFKRLGMTAGILGFLDFLNKLLKPAEAINVIGETVENFGKTVQNLHKGILKVIGSISDLIGELVKLVDEVVNTLKQIQENLKAGVLIEIAIAIAILAGALYLLSLIDVNNISELIAPLGSFMAILGSIALITSIISELPGKLKDFAEFGKGLIAFAAAVAIICAAMYLLSKVNYKELIPAWGAIELVMFSMAGVAKILSSEGGFLGSKAQRMTKGLGGLIKMAIAIYILSSAMVKLAEVAKDNEEGLGNALASIELLLITLTGVAFAMSKFDAKGFKGAGVSLMVMAFAIKILSKSIESLGNMKPKALEQGMEAVISLLLVMSVAAFALGKSSVSAIAGAAALLIISYALQNLMSVFDGLGGMSPEKFEQALGGFVATLFILVVALNFMKSAIGGALSLVLVAASLTILMGVVERFADLGDNGSTAIAQIAASLAILMIACFLFNEVPILGIVKFLLLLGGLSVIVAAFGAAAILVGIGLRSLASGIKALAGVTGYLPAFALGVIVLVGVLAILGAVGTAIIAPLAILTAAFLLFGISVALIGSGISNVAVGFKTLASIDSSQFKNTAENLLKFVKSLTEMKTYTSDISEAATAIATSLGEMAQKANAATVKIKGVGQAGKVMARYFAEGIIDNKGYAEKAGSALTTALISKINSGYNSFKSAGSNLIKGMINGIASQQESLERQVQLLEAKAERAVKAKAKIKSPSRVWAKIGSYLGLGLIKGMASTEGQISRTAEEMAETSETAVMSAIDRITTSLDGPDSPTITPVVDLSNVDAAARSINASLSTQQAMGISANIANSPSRLDVATNQILAGMKDALVNANVNQNGGEMQSVTIEVPLNINGREFARATVSDIQTQLNVNQARSDRLVGAQ